MLTCRVISVLNKAGIKHETHLFLEGENAPAADVAAVIKKVYEETGGDMIVASRSNKVYLFFCFLFHFKHADPLSKCTYLYDLSRYTPH